MISCIFLFVHPNKDTSYQTFHTLGTADVHVQPALSQNAKQV